MILGEATDLVFSVIGKLGRFMNARDLFFYLYIVVN